VLAGACSSSDIASAMPVKKLPGRTRMTAAVTYRFYTSNYERVSEAVANEPQVARETEYYLANIDKVTSIDDFMADSRLVDYAMKAYGLEDMSYAKAFVRKLLEEGVDDSSSLANQLTDQRYHQLASDFNFERYGEITTTFERTRSGVVELYQRQSIEEQAGETNTGARLALYFQRRAGEIDSVYDILGDEALFEVVRVNLGLPDQMSLLDIDKQVEMITDRLDLSDLSDSEFVDDFLNDFVVRWDVKNPEASSVPNIAPITSGVQTISTDLLATIQNLKTGG
jgi:hypothetical protein